MDELTQCRFDWVIRRATQSMQVRLGRLHDAFQFNFDVYLLALARALAIAIAIAMEMALARADTLSPFSSPAPFSSHSVQYAIPPVRIQSALPLSPLPFQFARHIQLATGAPSNPPILHKDQDATQDTSRMNLRTPAA